jgi:hypothetical protein
MALQLLPCDLSRFSRKFLTQFGIVHFDRFKKFESVLLNSATMNTGKLA